MSEYAFSYHKKLEEIVEENEKGDEGKERKTMHGVGEEGGREQKLTKKGKKEEKKSWRKETTRHAPFAKGTGEVRRMDEVTVFLVKKTFWPLWSQIEIWANKFWRGVNLMHMHELHW